MSHSGQDLSSYWYKFHCSQFLLQHTGTQAKLQVWPSPHAFPHWPQFAVVSRDVHALSQQACPDAQHTPLQSVSPVAHPEQSPLIHVWPSPHAFPHWSQFAVVSRNVHALSQQACPDAQHTPLQSLSPVAHPEQSPLMHVWPSPHGLPHSPQFDVVS
jgi:hypothetical protein